MSDIFELLHRDLVFLRSEGAFKEFIDVYKFRGGKYIFASFQDLQNFYYPNEKGEEDKTRPLLACRDSYGCQVSNTEYEKMLSRRNILTDKRISKEDYYKLIGLG